MWVAAEVIRYDEVQILPHGTTRQQQLLVRCCARCFISPKQVKQRLMNYLANVTIPARTYPLQTMFQTRKPPWVKNVNVCYC